MTQPPLFDARARLARRDRAARSKVEAVFAERAFADLLERIGDNVRRFERALLLGVLDPAWISRLGALVGSVRAVDPSAALAARSGGAAVSEGELGFPDGSFDLVVAAGTLDTAEDLPGALAGIRRLLVPDGLLVGAVPGAGSLPRLRAALAAADERAGGAAPRLHPALDARTVGDLLARAGFVLTVVDVDRVRAGYADARALVRDLRTHAATNLLARRSRRHLGKADLRVLEQAFARPGERTYEEINILHFSTWSPGPDQPQPARRGSATTSLAAALKKPA